MSWSRVAQNKMLRLQQTNQFHLTERQWETLQHIVTCRSDQFVALAYFFGYRGAIEKIRSQLLEKWDESRQDQIKDDLYNSIKQGKGEFPLYALDQLEKEVLETITYLESCEYLTSHQTFILRRLIRQKNKVIIQTFVDLLNATDSAQAWSRFCKIIYREATKHQNSDPTTKALESIRGKGGGSSVLETLYSLIDPAQDDVVGAAADLYNETGDSTEFLDSVQRRLHRLIDATIDRQILQIEQSKWLDQFPLTYRHILLELCTQRNEIFHAAFSLVKDDAISMDLFVDTMVRLAETRLPSTSQKAVQLGAWDKIVFQEVCSEDERVGHIEASYETGELTAEQAIEKVKNVCDFHSFSVAQEKALECLQALRKIAYFSPAQVNRLQLECMRDDPLLLAAVSYYHETERLNRTYAFQELCDTLQRRLKLITETNRT